MMLAVFAAPAVLAAQSGAPVVPSPHLMVGDRVVVKVWPEVKLSDTVLVDDRGEISLPHVGSIGVLALDYDGLRDTLRARYAAFLRSPVIDVVAFRRVTVNGAVGKPDVYMIDVTSTIRDVIARAGGVAPYGATHRVSILREGRSIAAPNWDQPAKTSEYPLQSGDVIFVGRRPWWVENLGTVTGVAGLAVSLAFTLNGEPLPDMYGAPLRLRIESMHGYKMVKWVRSVSWIHDYREVGDGMGGTREDSGYQDIDARI